MILTNDLHNEILKVIAMIFTYGLHNGKDNLKVIAVILTYDLHKDNMKVIAMILTR